MISKKDFFKLMIDSVHGKKLQNLWKRIDVWLVNNAENFLRYTSRPTHIACKIFGDNFAAIHKIKLVLILNKPIYLGFTVLELRKWLMYDFH